MHWIVLAVLMPIFYFASSGAAFVAMYIWPDAFPNRLASRVYAPLEWLARLSRQFGRIYTTFHWWCYRQFVDDYRKSGAPTPPPPRFSN
jgi:hypothetical protein